MSLHDFVKVNTHYTRSVNLERDSDSVDVVSAYIPTSRALRTFARISESLNTELSPRAWSLIGPYGSGKSSFSVFLSHLLSDPEEKGSQVARQVLKKADRTLASIFTNETKKSDGYLKVLITGAPESMSKRLVKGLTNAAETFDSNGPYRGYKRDLYEGGIRVPFIARWPGTVIAGTTTEVPTAFWDYLPTAVSLAGLTPPEGIDGISYAPTLLGENQELHDYLYWQFDRSRMTQAVRSGPWKAVRLDTTEALELYHLEDDPSETTDVASTNQTIADSLLSIMQRINAE